MKQSQVDLCSKFFQISVLMNSSLFGELRSFWISWNRYSICETFFGSWLFYQPFVIFCIRIHFFFNIQSTFSAKLDLINFAVFFDSLSKVILTTFLIDCCIVESVKWFQIIFLIINLEVNFYIFLVFVYRLSLIKRQTTLVLFDLCSY